MTPVIVDVIVTLRSYECACFVIYLSVGLLLDELLHFGFLIGDSQIVDQRDLVRVEDMFGFGYVEHIH